ncbi:hypothetical protein THRCLA_06203 [Thraustotheca clavata]|uniref:FYVE-type domain-containing protein n=1 Tax=Thraustotheca clavata TaxID=74557 RepID=A0A1V9ZQ43_9STRA|nr:hypothetical protein THRCLA_06203 [Thraustotheca clavata]
MARKQAMRDLLDELPSNFVEAPSLSQAELSYLSDLAHRTFNTFLSSTYGTHPMQEAGWSFRGDHHGVQIFQGPVLANEPRVRPHRFVTSMAATIDQVQDAMSNLTDDQMQASLEHYTSDLVDMAILHRVVRPTTKEPNMNAVVRWFVAECPKPLNNRDFCVLEVQRQWALPSGRRAWAMSQHSIRLPTCPELKPALKLIRGSLYNSGYLFIETDTPGRLEVHVRIELDFKGVAPTWIYKSIMKHRATSLIKLSQWINEAPAIQHAKSNAGRNSLIVNLVPLSERKHCQLCTRKFSPLRWKANCCACGEVFCWKCTQGIRIKGKIREPQRICFECAEPDATASKKGKRSPHKTMDFDNEWAIADSPTNTAPIKYQPAAATAFSNALVVASNTMIESSDRYHEEHYDLRPIALARPENPSMTQSSDTSYMTDEEGFWCDDDEEDENLLEFELNVLPSVKSSSPDDRHRLMAQERHRYDTEMLTSALQLLQQLCRDVPTFRNAPQLTDAESEYLESLAFKSFTTFINSTLMVHPVEESGFQPKGSHQGVEIFQGPKYISSSPIRPYRFITTIEGTLEDVEAIFSQNTNGSPFPPDFHLDGILDTAIVHQVRSSLTPESSHCSELSENNTEINENISVRWFAVECPFMHDRDFTVLEMNRKWTLPSGQRVWALSQHSIRLPSCPELPPNMKVVRATLFQSGMYCIETEPGKLELHMRLEVDFKGQLPQWVFKRLMQMRAASFGKIGQYIKKYREYQKQAINVPRRSTVTMVPLKSRKHCQLCTRKFNPLRWKVHCCRCGEVFCYKCTEHQRLPMHPRDMQQMCYECARPSEMRNGTPYVLDSPEWKSPTKNNFQYRPAASANALFSTLSSAYDTQVASDFSEDSWYDKELKDAQDVKCTIADLAEFQLTLQFVVPQE